MKSAYKKWVFVLIGGYLAFIALNLFIWKFYTEDLLTFKKYYNGGLDRMGYIVGSKHYRKPESTLPRKHIENVAYRGQHVDVITVGDSFSNVKENGRDPLYQDWLASVHGLDVLNVQPLKGATELSTVVILLNSGYLDTVKPRFIIVENVERNCVGSFSGKLDLSETRPLRVVDDYYRKAGYVFNPPDVGFLNTGNFKFILNSILYRFSDKAFFSEVYARDLSRPLFSVENDRRLLFFHCDLEYIPLSTEENIRALNDNFNRVADLLRNKGMTLYFMPAADKYNMYSDYVVDNPYPKSVFFELLRKMPKRYVLVDTKAILEDEIRRGEKDVYYADDTHWSWKAVKKIAESMRF
jgi:hypothetical protein